MTTLPKPLQFIKRIHAAGVRYLLIGRQAVIAYGGPVQSMDYDIFIDGSEQNTEQLLTIAEEFDLCPSIARAELIGHFKFRLENSFIVDVFRAKTLALGKGQKLTFAEMYQRRKTMSGESGLEINLPDIDDLIALKKIRSLPKDLADVKYLQAIKRK